MSQRSQNTIAARPSSLGGRSPSRPALVGTFSPEPPLHLAAGTDSDDCVVCGCDYGCWECDETRVRSR
jgi:hypothetical protein